MIDINKAIIARVVKEGKPFEVLVDCEKAVEFKHGKAKLDDVLATEEIYESAKQGKHASKHEMERIFKTSDIKKIAEIIIKEAKLQLTADYQRKQREQKRKQIIDLIHVNAVDPTTNLPHPITRIENAIEEAKVKINDSKSAEEQVQDIVSQIRRILPIKYEIRKIQIKIPAQYTGKSYPVLKQFGKLLKDEWKNDGSLVAVVELPAGMQESLFDKLNNLTHGNIESEVLK